MEDFKDREIKICKISCEEMSQNCISCQTGCQLISQRAYQKSNTTQYKDYEDRFFSDRQVWYKGKRGKDIIKIKNFMKELGYSINNQKTLFDDELKEVVRRFQRECNIDVDGVIGKQFRFALKRALVSGEKSLTGNEELVKKVITFTSNYEGEGYSAVSDNFDGQGISFGILQWCLGQGSLQNFLKDYNNSYESDLRDSFDNKYDELIIILAKTNQDAVDWAKEIQSKGGGWERWKTCFIRLGEKESCRNLQIKKALGKINSAAGLCLQFDLHHERALALMFDIITQNGSGVFDKAFCSGALKEIEFNGKTPRQLFYEWVRNNPEGSERDKMIALATFVALNSNKTWYDDVRRRKVTIASGIGWVHGSDINMEEIKINGPDGVPINSFSLKGNLNNPSESRYWQEELINGYFDPKRTLEPPAPNIEGFRNTEIIYYDQVAPVWNKESLTWNTIQKNVAESGCGPTSIAMAISTLQVKTIPNTNEEVNPFNVFKNLINRDGCYHGDIGLFRKAVDEAAKLYGLESNEINNEEKIKEVIRNKKLVVFGVGRNNALTDGGHIVLVHGIETINGKEYFLVADPNRRNNKYYRESENVIQGIRSDGFIKVNVDYLMKIRVHSTEIHKLY